MSLSTTTIKQSMLIPASPEPVYQALLDPKLHAVVTGSPASGGTKVGDSFKAWDGYIFGKHLKLVPGKTIVQHWQTTEWPDGYSPSTVTFTFAKDPKGTKLTLVHKDVPAEQSADYAQGWKDFYWEPLEQYFKSH